MSSRRIKQAIYGIFYLAIFGGIVTGIYFLFLKPSPSCFDKVQNEGEAGVDCGGPCVNICIPSTLQQLSPLVVKSLPLPNGNATIVAQVENANTDFAARSFDYTISLYNAVSTTSFQSFSGTSFLYPDESKWLILPNEPILGAADHATIAFDNVNWVPAASLGSAPRFNFTNVTTVSAGQGLFAVQGNVTNNDVASFAQVTIVAIFKDAGGNRIGASQTVLDTLAPNATQQFTIQYPTLQNINISGTELAAYGLRE